MKKLTLFLLLLCTHAMASDKFFNQLKWVQWSIKQEEYNPVQVVKGFTSSFNAYAYKEGDSCLVLGYQGTFTKNVCRLETSVLEKNKCAKSYYPCQPQLFGEGLCVKNTSKRLTHQCAVESIKKVSSKLPETENLKAFKKELLSSGFDLTKLEAKDFPNEIKMAWPEQMTPEKFEERKQYLGQLCQSVKKGAVTGHQKQDLKDCESIHGLASQIAVKEKEEKPVVAVVEVAVEKKVERTIAEEKPVKEDCVKCQVEVKKEDPAVSELEKVVAKIQVKEKILPEEIPGKPDLNKDLPDDYCHPDVVNAKDDIRYLHTEDYKDKRFANEENRLLYVETVKNSAGVEEIHNFQMVAPTLGKVMKNIENGEVIEAYDPVVAHRGWNANFYGRSSQMSFEVTDYPVIEDKDPQTKEVQSRYNSASFTMTRFTFFPRKVTPTASLEGDELVMTIPTGEVIKFDSQTRRVKEGVFKEKSRADGGKDPSFISKSGKGALRTYYKPDSTFSYQGKGVWIQTIVDANKDEAEAGLVTIRNGSPTCKSAECSSCKVPASDIYVRNRGFHTNGEKKTAWSCEKIRFQTDDDFNDYLKKKCKFTLPDL